VRLLLPSLLYYMPDSPSPSIAPLYIRFYFSPTLVSPFYKVPLLSSTSSEVVVLHIALVNLTVLVLLVTCFGLFILCCHLFSPRFGFVSGQGGGKFAKRQINLIKWFWFNLIIIYHIISHGVNAMPNISFPLFTLQPNRTATWGIPRHEKSHLCRILGYVCT
jgi:hypothetical protein